VGGSWHRDPRFERQASVFPAVSVFPVVRDLVERAALERLKWRSRRGLLELDLVFERFWAGPGRELEEAEAAALERLLLTPDNDLLDLVMGRRACEESELRAVLDKLRT
jgi:succinate dehydrogenase flavin-adding protein (antitoxin of CptAB toxin-antitoxin module)